MLSKFRISGPEEASLSLVIFLEWIPGIIDVNWANV